MQYIINSEEEQIIHSFLCMFLSDFIQPVKLPSRSTNPPDFVGEIARVSGWGQTSDGENIAL
jgi:hypothetical protein